MLLLQAKDSKQRADTLKHEIDRNTSVYKSGAKITCFFGWIHWMRQELKAMGFSNAQIDAIMKVRFSTRCLPVELC